MLFVDFLATSRATFLLGSLQNSEFVRRVALKIGFRGLGSAKSALSFVVPASVDAPPSR